MSHKNSFAQESPSALYVPLIGITAVPDPLSLPNGSGFVMFHYAVKNFIREAALTNVVVVDDACKQVVFVEGDDNHDGKLDYSETWRYQCGVSISHSIISTATATAHASNITAVHKAHATVLADSQTPPPLVSIVNVTKVAYPLSLPSEGGTITYTYKVNNPGIVPLSNVLVTDNKCSAMSGKLGDTNGNDLLDINETWIYTCVTKLTQTTTNTAHVTAFANGLKAVDDVSLTVKVAPVILSNNPTFPTTGETPNMRLSHYGRIGIWVVLAAFAVLLTMFMIKKEMSHKTNRGALSKKLQRKK
ncbi:MAG TPA: hypothetical protein VLG12_04475 [Candidatus Saccharimonadales bacterium]|nr:hypothetical protein [Candidatus Saccharimonadales bacterium]